MAKPDRPGDVRLKVRPNRSVHVAGRGYGPGQVFEIDSKMAQYLLDQRAVVEVKQRGR